MPCAPRRVVDVLASHPAIIHVWCGGGAGLGAHARRAAVPRRRARGSTPADREAAVPPTLPLPSRRHLSGKCTHRGPPAYQQGWLTGSSGQAHGCGFVGAFVGAPPPARRMAADALPPQLARRSNRSRVSPRACSLMRSWTHRPSRWAAVGAAPREAHCSRRTAAGATGARGSERGRRGRPSDSSGRHSRTSYPCAAGQGGQGGVPEQDHRRCGPGSEPACACPVAEGVQATGARAGGHHHGARRRQPSLRTQRFPGCTHAYAGDREHSAL